MKRIAIVCVFLAWVSAAVFPQSGAGFLNQLDFSTTLEDIYNMDEETIFQKVEEGAVYILSGVVVSRQVINPDPDAFEVILEVVGGKWEDLTDVSMYKCVLWLQGPAFASRITSSRSGTVADDEIAVNSRILILGSLIGMIDMPEGPLPAVEGFMVRIIN